MRYPAKEYAKFLISLEEKEIDGALKKLVAFLQKNGDIKEWRKIIEAYEFLYYQKTKGKKATISYCGEIDQSKIKDELKNFEVEFIEDKTLIGGISIKIGDEKIDSSLKNRLEEIKKILIK